jgi:hypothetical protein
MQLGTDLLTKSDLNARISSTVSALHAAGMTKGDTAAALTAAIRRFYRKMVITDEYHPSSRLPLSTRVTLVKASESRPQVESLGLDYGLSTICDGALDVRVVQGSHETFVTSSEGAPQVSSIISCS